MKKDYTNEIIVNGAGQSIKIIGYHEKNENHKNESLWDYQCPYCNSIVYNTIYKIKRNKGCKNCTYDRVSSSEMLSQQYVENKIKNDNPILTIRSKYHGKNKKIIFYCNKHDIEFSTMASTALYHKNAILCPKCIIEKNSIFEAKYAKEDIDKDLRLHNYLWLNKDFYQNASSVLECKCLKCNSITHFNYSSFKQGRKCRYCSGYSLKSNKKFKEEIFNLVGSEYSILSEYKGNKKYFTIKHNACGNIWDTTPINFLHGGRRCPICCSSRGETEIIKYLKSHNISFDYQKKFNNLCGINNGLLSYDFYLPKYNLLIEYQGEQHDRPIEYFGGEEQFKIQKEHDNRKRKYAMKNNMQLLEIWYYDFDSIENILNSYLVI